MKYRLLHDDTIECEGRTCYRIQCATPFVDVKAGDLGGYIESEHNLSGEGACWVYDFENFFALRIHPDAQPEIQDLAQAMRQVMSESVPQALGYGEWHLPYITKEERKGDEYPTALLRKLPVARCARVSYKAFDGTVDADKDLALYKKLVGAHPMHASPAEHQAMPTHPLTMLPVGGNFDGRQQHRKLLEAGVVE